MQHSKQTILFENTVLQRLNMAGRGRGGKTGSLTAEQMQALGCVGKDMPQVQTAPPPTYPPVINKPTTVETTPIQTYQLLWKEDFLNRMHDSPYFIISQSEENPNIFGKHWQEKRVFRQKPRTGNEFNFKLMPRELNTTSRKRSALVPKLKQTAKKANIEDRLKQLEQKELKSSGENENEDAKKDSDSEEDQEDAEAELDNEMDEENDYANDYFDNGEAYNEEDDNLDDGPVY